MRVTLGGPGMRKPGRQQGVRRYQRYGQMALDVAPTLEIRPMLYPVAGCARCADIVAAHLLGADVYDVMLDHLYPTHTLAGSMHSVVNELAKEVQARMFM